MREYNNARVGYLKAVLNNNQDLEIKNLKILVSSGKKLKKNITKYEKELKKYNGTINNKSRIEPIKITKPIKIKKITKIKKPKISKIDTNKSQYTIKSVVSKDNKITIEFNTNITKDYVRFFEKKVKNANQDIYDIKGRFKDAHPTKLRISGVKQIVIKQEKYNTLRILFEDKINLKTVYSVNKKRLTISVLNLKNKSSKKSTSKAKISKSPKVIKTGQNRVIVLDAGHGGKDVGAVGKGKRYEKVVVFKVTKYLESILKKRGYKVYLTRNNDRFIKVKNRTILANKKKADIFLSIHANAAHKSRIHEARGIETFFLSPARSERAKRVAAKENKSDIRTMSYSTKNVFLESLNRPRITASQKLAIDTQRNILFTARSLYKDAVDGGVREGPFWVLVGAQMPSILIEIGYISHKEEGRRLYETRYQKKLALGIANGIDSYFAKNP
ncbi:N-acetylmuramoyl-L-alanine amidase [Arcobacter sp. LA11]|uniref:N-acetylmuramoyl-L-alanine amidase family protein n=1 Tax=Arcobacter sp. LA11 TaxID=1898176 RepID=UPI000B13278D|nr:N-acetylmuramoyl-L-alanine amidase [Arcobacter sp. LA11]